MLGLDLGFDKVTKELDRPQARLCAGRYYRHRWDVYFARCHLFLAKEGLFYSESDVTFYEIPLDGIKKLKVKKCLGGYDVRFRSNKRHHYVIFNAECIQTEKAGAGKENCEKLVEFLKKFTEGEGV